MNLIIALIGVSNIGGSYPPNPLLKTGKHQKNNNDETKKLTKTRNKIIQNRIKPCKNNIKSYKTIQKLIKPYKNV